MTERKRRVSVRAVKPQNPLAAYDGLKRAIGRRYGPYINHVGGFQPVMLIAVAWGFRRAEDLKDLHAADMLDRAIRCLMDCDPVLRLELGIDPLPEAAEYTAEAAPLGTTAELMPARGEKPS